MWLTLLLLLVFACCVAFLYTEGTWSNIIRWISIVIAGLIATNWFEPITSFLNDWDESFTALWDFVSFWALFAGSLGIIRMATGFLSQVKVRFYFLAERIGSGVSAALVGYTMIAITLFSLHLAPLPEEFLYGNFQAGESMFLGLAPDQQWRGLAVHTSRGSMARFASADEYEADDFGFDPYDEYMDKYAERRSNLEDYMRKEKAIRVR